MPLNLTVELATKLLPFTVRIKGDAGTDEALAVKVAGLKSEMFGKGLVTMNDKALLVPPPGPAVSTVIDRVPAVAKSLARSSAVS